MTTTNNDLSPAEVAEAVRDEVEEALTAAEQSPRGSGKVTIRRHLDVALDWLKSRTDENAQLAGLAATVASLSLARFRRDLIEDLEAVLHKAETVLAELESEESD
jgi:hypothetical protein